jgi:hypothetical protein
MENLIIDLKQKLIQRKMNEMKFIESLNAESDNYLILVLTGKIFELEFLIDRLDDLIVYHYKINKISK